MVNAIKNVKHNTENNNAQDLSRYYVLLNRIKRRNTINGLKNNQKIGIILYRPNMRTSTVNTIAVYVEMKYHEEYTKLCSTKLVPEIREICTVPFVCILCTKYTLKYFFCVLIYCSCLCNSVLTCWSCIRYVMMSWHVVLVVDTKVFERILQVLNSWLWIFSLVSFFMLNTR